MDGGRGWRGRPTKAFPRKGRRGEAGPRENDGASSGIPPRLPETANPGSQDAVVQWTTSVKWSLKGGPRRQEVSYLVRYKRPLLSGLTAADQGGLPRYFLGPHQALRTREAFDLGRAHPLPCLRRQQLVSDTKKAVTPLKLTLLGGKR